MDAVATAWARIDTFYAALASSRGLAVAAGTVGRAPLGAVAAFFARVYAFDATLVIGRGSAVDAGAVV